MDKGKDIRIALGRVPELQSMCRGMLDAAQDADTRFVFMLAYDFLGMLEMWDGRTDAWYSMNADLVTSMKEKLSKYLERMSEALKKRGYDAMVECSKDWCSDAHLLTRRATRDVRAGRT